MTQTVWIRNKSAAQVMEIVRELRATGLIQGKDFEFKFRQKTWSGWNVVEESGAEFTFTSPKWATFMAIKYGTS